MKWFTPIVGTLAFVTTGAFGQVADKVELRITASSVIVDGQKQLSDDAAVNEEFAALAKQNPKPNIHVSLDPGVPFERVVRFTQIMTSHPEFRLGLITQHANP
jgi:biopolymer transport protein ExbD